jgi:uncharacterized protein YchJ
VCEADIDDFQTINRRLTDAGLRLYELTQLSRLADGTLGWFYPVYINRALDFVRPRAFWDETNNAAIIAAQDQRRRALLAENAQFFDQVRRTRMAGDSASERPSHNAAATQDQRRRALLADNAELHDQVRRTRMAGISPSEKQSRNAPCNCGSGKKYKRCCGAPA